jgi:lipid-A-disaccharide synthase
MDRREPLIFIVAGETSGDNLAGRLMSALRRATGDRVRFAGVGGPQSEAQGLTSLFPMSDLSVMGLAEVLPHLPRLVRRINQTTAAARSLTPDAVVTVDSASFSLRLAHHLRGTGHPICRAPALGLASRSRQEARQARQPHHGFATVRGFLLRRTQHSLDLCRPPGH